VRYPLLLAATRCAIVLAEACGWSAATVTGVFYGLKAVLDGHTGKNPVLVSEVRERVRPRSHSSATRVAEVLAELGLLHDDTTAAIRTRIDRRTGELPAGFRRDVRAWLVVLLDGDTRIRPRSHATVRVHFGIVRSFIECRAATRGHLREITSGDVDTVLEPLRGHRRCNAIMALRSLFRFARRRGLTFADPTAHLSGGRACERTLLPMTEEEIHAVQQAAVTPAQRLAIALAAVHAARPQAIRELTLDDIDLPGRRITLAGHRQRLGELTRDALLA
jgi:integrase